MSASPIKGAATVGGHPTVVAKAQWTINAEEKTSTASILGGTATVFRRPDGGLSVRWVSGDEAIATQSAMNDVTTVAAAQLRAETLVYETLAKTHPQVLEALALSEAAAEAGAAGEDPF